MAVHTFTVTVEDDDEVDAEWWADCARGACEQWNPVSVTFSNLRTEVTDHGPGCDGPLNCVCEPA